MKSLHKYISEGILSDIDNMIDDAGNHIKNIIITFINNNYKYKSPKKLIISEYPNDDGKYIVNYNGGGDVEVTNKNITRLVNDYFVWGEVTSFSCMDCYSLKTLEGAPEKTTYFCCNGCEVLKTLRGGPKYTKKDFSCGSCVDLQEFGYDIMVGQNFTCNDCYDLKTLEGAPKKVSGSFYCGSCHSLKNLKGAPKEVGRFFDCSWCGSLESLEGAPKKVATKYSDGGFGCFEAGSESGVKFTKDDVRKVCNVVNGEIHV